MLRWQHRARTIAPSNAMPEPAVDSAPRPLRYTHRFVIASQRDRQRWVPWIFQPPRVHGVELELDPPVSAAEVHAIAQGLYERGELCDRWVFDGGGWRREALPLSDRPREGELHKIALFETFEHEMISDGTRADHERDRRSDEEWAREQGLEPERALSFDQLVDAWRRALPSHRSRAFGGRAELQREIERIRGFFAFEWMEDGFHFRLELTKPPGSSSEGIGRDRIRDALVALGFREDRRSADASQDAAVCLTFDGPLGVWDGGDLRARCGDQGCSLEVVLMSEHGPAARDRAEMLLRCAERLERASGLAARSVMTGEAGLAIIRERVAASLDLLEGDGFFFDGQRWPDVDVEALRGLAKERHDLASSDVLRAAGRTLALSEAQTNPRFALFVGCAIAAALLALLWTWAAVGVVVFLVLAATTPRAIRRDIELGLDELTITTRGEVQRFRLPLSESRGGADRGVRDKDGRPVPVELGSKVLAALIVRSALAQRPMPVANRVALEAIFWATEQQQRWSRGRREGYVAVAIGAAGGLAFFEDQQGLDEWAAKATEPHRVAFVRTQDASGKGASVGYPSEVEWCAPVQLPARGDVFAEE
jgi:hypothetical protein